MISILFGSRGRPEMLATMIKSFVDKAKTPTDIQFCIYVDNDDVKTAEKLNSIKISYNQINPDLIRYRVGPRLILSDIVNKCYQFSSGELIYFGADDLVQHTKNYDEIIWESYSCYQDKIYYGYGSDGHWHSQFGTHPIISKKWIEVLGYVTPPYFAHAYGDRWLWDIAEFVGRKQYLPITNYHFHHDYQQRPKDSTDTDQKVRFDKERPDLVYVSKREEIIRDANKLRKYIEEYGRK